MLFAVTCIDNVVLERSSSQDRKGTGRGLTERVPSMRNGSHHTAARVELGDTIIVTAALPGTGETQPREIEFDVVAIVGDEEGAPLYAICYCTSADEFMVTNADGVVLTDEALAQEILNEFLEHAHDEEAEGETP